MSRVLLDHNVPRPLVRLITGHLVTTAADEGWDALSNGNLLAAADRAGFEVFVTGDKNIQYQNNMKTVSMALVELSDPTWPVVRNNVPAIQAAIDAATPGSIQVVTFPRPPRRRRASKPSP